MDYKNGKIYKLICSETQKVYIGATAQPLYKRLYQHKAKYNKAMSKTFIEPKIFLIEDFPCERKEQLNSRERYYIENFDCVNKCIPGRKTKEYYEDNKERLSKINKEYNKKNKERLSKYKKQWYDDNKLNIKEETKQKNKELMKEKITCDCGSTFTKHSKARHERSKKHKAFILNLIIHA